MPHNDPVMRELAAAIAAAKFSASPHQQPRSIEEPAPVVVINGVIKGGRQTFIIHPSKSCDGSCKRHGDLR
jgi:hypothetical protein